MVTSTDMMVTEQDNVLPLQSGVVGESLLSDRTRELYRKDLTYIAAWYRFSYGKQIGYPLTIDQVMDFITQHCLDGLPTEVEQKLVEIGLRRTGLKIWRHSTLQRRLSALSVEHNDRQMVNPVSSPTIRQLMRRVRRHEVRTRPEERKSAITKSVLEKLITTCNSKSLRDVHDQALMLVAFSAGGRRRSEVVAMKLEHLERCEEGFYLTIPSSKTDQGAKGQVVPIYGEAAKALEVWINRSGIKEGYLFRGIKNDGQLMDVLSAQGVNRIIKRRAKQAGIESSSLSAHSIRSGFVTECFNQGINIGDVMSMTLHKVEHSILRYFRAESFSTNRAAKVL